MLFTVVGTAELPEIPTEATVSLAISTEADTRAAALSSARQSMAKLAELCKSYTAGDKSPAKDWHMSGISSHSWRPHDDNGRPLDAQFGVTASGGITFTNTDNLGQFLEEVAGAKHTNVNYVNWALSAKQLTDIHDQLLHNAVSHATHKAQVLAQAAKVDKINLTAIREQNSETHHFEQGAPRMAMAAYSGAADEPTIELQPAPTTVSASIVAEFTSVG